jgi:hypothetical protein
VDRLYQVFVSSTFLDLQAERAAVVSSLLQLDAMPAGMELFPATDDDAWTLIKRVIDSCDYYLLVIGGKYGSVDPSSDLSYTEMEYDYAVQEAKPVMAFLHGDPDKIEFGKSEQDTLLRERLSAFREKVQESKHVKFWTGGPDVLAGKVALSFAKFRNTYPAAGWVRGDQQASNETLTELNEVRKQLEEAQHRLSASRKQPPAATEALAQGNDTLELGLSASARLRTSSDELWASGDTYSANIPATATWNELFSYVGPTLLDEADESVLHRRLNAWFSSKYSEAAVDALVAQVRDQGEEVRGYEQARIAVHQDDFGTLLVQFRALGLIDKSERKRSVSDKGRYWTLTEHGDEHLVSLRAIQRGTSVELPRSDDAIAGAEAVAGSLAEESAKEAPAASS